MAAQLTNIHTSQVRDSPWAYGSSGTPSSPWPERPHLPDSSSSEREMVAQRLEPETAAPSAAASPPAAAPSMRAASTTPVRIVPGAAALPGSPPREATKAEKAAALARIAELEAMLTNTPHEDAELRLMLQCRIQAQRDVVRLSKPLGARRDQARLALDRAKTRQADAEQAVATANAVLESVEQHVQLCEAEVRSVEAEITAQRHAEEAAMNVEPTVADGTAAQPSDQRQLHTILERMIGGLRNDPWTDPSIVAIAEQHAAQILAGFRDTIARAKEAKEAAAVAANGGNPVRRVSGKQSPPQEVPVARTRHVTKRPARRVMLDYFRMAKKVTRKGGKAKAGA